MPTDLDSPLPQDEILREALQLPAGEREAFVERACGADSTLAEAVLTLLRESDDADPYLASGGAFAGPLWEELAGEVERRQELAPGARVGPYRVVREVGRGGMAVVYLAERADGLFEQRVALKLMQSGSLPASAPAELLRRFEQERRILASLSHPAIARLLDAGVTAEGRPYFAMEYVEGLPIDRHCDERGLTVEQRLGLFTVVARAVEAAHRSLIVHRDLKPSNVLVSGEGEVKLLDFGIARPLDAEALPGAAPPTRGFLRALTPEYASPEQVRGEPVTTATDVYQLGLLLYELLTGRRALRLGGRSEAELARVICEVEPRAPSDALRDGAAPDAAALEEVAAARGMTPEALARRLAGDLDAIALTALAKEPARRYASVGELLEDLRRHAEGRPVLARRPTLAYRAGRFLRRHRLGVAAGGLLAASVAAGVSATAWQAVRARRAAADAEAVAEYVTGLFDLASPSRPQGDAVTARELVDRGAERLDSELAAQPALQARLRAVLGRVYASLGLYEPAAEQLGRAVSFLRRPAGAEARDLSRALGDLAGVRISQGAYDEAAALARESLALDRRRLPADHEQVATNLQRLGLALKEQGRSEEAEQLFRQALAMRRRLFGERHPAVVESLNQVATARFGSGDYAAAEALYREALAVARTLPGDGYPSLPASMANLAAALSTRGDSTAAEPLLREALALWRARLGDDHPDLALYLRNLATTLAREGDRGEAAELYLEVLRIQRLAYGEEHHEVAKTTYDLATLLHGEGLLAESEPLYRGCVAMLERLVGGNHPHFARALAGLARLELDQGRGPEAERHFRQALEILEGKLPPGHNFTAAARLGLARALVAQGRDLPTAEAILRRELELFGTAFGAEDPRTAEARLFLGECLLARGERSEGRALVEQSAAVLAKAYGESDFLTRRGRRLLAAP
jgi:serine/threonine-protein kinase